MSKKRKEVVDPIRVQTPEAFPAETKKIRGRGRVKKPFLEPHVVLDHIKDVHVKLLSGTYGALRIELFKRNLTIQEIFEEVAQLIAMNNYRILNILDELVVKKRDNFIKKFTEKDAEKIFDTIQMLKDEDEES